MSSTFQTVAALAIVAVAAGWMLYAAIRKRGASSCGSGGCSAVSREVKELQAKLRR